ncbi:hypothetical protein QVD17_07776 [Tagetes erecta]|uniref:Uncharacterized protein n=1 Tax=Tagetes erecta TaxID=13708 RepID=A0AAD8KZA0_TARER|nr:hypothetical protein QVD17_07776 [Tagetes erecta]
MARLESLVSSVIVIICGHVVHEAPLFEDVFPDEPHVAPTAQVEPMVEGEVEDVVSSSESDDESEKGKDCDDGNNDDESFSSEDDGDDDVGEFVFVQHNTCVIPPRKMTVSVPSSSSKGRKKSVA